MDMRITRRAVALTSEGLREIPMTPRRRIIAAARAILDAAPGAETAADYRRLEAVAREISAAAGRAATEAK